MQRFAKSLAFMGLALAGVTQANEEEEGHLEEDQEMPEDESNGEMRMSEAKLTGLFKKLDKDGDGKVTQADLLAFNRHMRKQRDAKYFEEFWGELDRDADGKVTLEEATHDQEDMSDGKEYTTVMFKAADKDSNGFLNKAEALGFSSMEHEPVVEAAVAKFAMKNSDEDGDGKLSMEEFKKSYFGTGMEDESHEEIPEEAADMKEAFAHMDKNADGSLDVVEMQEWESGRHFEEHSLEQLAKLADADGDGSITLQELLDTASMDEAMEHQYHLDGWANELEL